MSEYILILGWMGAMLAFTQLQPVYRQEWVCGKLEYRVNWVFALLVFSPVMIWAGFRSTGIGDSLLSSKIQKNLSEKWHFFKSAAFLDFFEVPVFSKNVANLNFA